MSCPPHESSAGSPSPDRRRLWLAFSALLALTFVSGCGEAPAHFDFRGYTIEPPPECEFHVIKGLQPAADLEIGNPFLDVYIVAFVEPKGATSEANETATADTEGKTSGSESDAQAESDEAPDSSPAPIGTLGEYTERALQYWTGDSTVHGTWTLVPGRGTLPVILDDVNMKAVDFELTGTLPLGREVRARVTCIDTDTTSPESGDFVQFVAWSRADSFRAPEVIRATSFNFHQFRRRSTEK